jgi:hypothetical protein
MSYLPYTSIKWRRLKLLIAENIVLGLAKGDHTYGFKDSLLEAANAIRDFRERYYPANRA